jgi:hypothetical protein
MFEGGCCYGVPDRLLVALRRTGGGLEDPFDSRTPQGFNGNGARLQVR